MNKTDQKLNSKSIHRETVEFTVHDLENITTATLYSLLDHIRLSQEEINKENMLLEKYITTFGAKKAAEMTTATKPNISKVEFISDLTEQLPAIVIPERRGKAKFKTDASAELSDSLSMMTTLTEDTPYSSSRTKKDAVLPIEERCEIAASQIKELIEKITKLHRVWFRRISPFKVKLEETAISNREIIQDISDFQRDVIKDGTNPVTGKIMMERVVLYFNRSIRSKETQIERSRLEYNFLRSLELKMEKELKLKLEMGSSMSEVDFNELKIENAQYMEKVEEKNVALLIVKRHLNLTLQLLRQCKLRLQQAIAQDISLRTQIQEQKDNIACTEEEIAIATGIKNKMKQNVNFLKNQLENYRVPDVMDYVNTQAEVYELKKLINVWQRRVTIAHHSFNSKTKSLKVGRCPKENSHVSQKI